jgi:VWFA-related protein
MNFGKPIMRFVAVFALALASFATAQTADVATSPPAAFRARSTLVLVPAMVRTRSGELVFTLTANDFAIKDDGVEQKVTLEKDTDMEPLALVVAIETGGSGARQLDNYGVLATALDAIVGAVTHKVAVVGFDGSPRVLQDFTSNLDVAESAIHNLQSGNHGAGILDTLAYSVNLLRKQPPEYRRAILLISETVDHGSVVKLEDALREISDTNTAIYSLGFSSSKSDTARVLSKLSSDEPGPPGGCMSKDPAAPSGSSRLAQTWECLSQLAPPLRAATIAAILGMNGTRRNVPETVAHLTGGEYFPFSNVHNLEKSLFTISNHIPNRYVLSFQPQSPHPGLHSIALRLKEYPDLVVTARRNYWVDSDTIGELGPSSHP